MKIGILTYHRSYNYGAFIQCYSLTQRLMQEYPDAEIEVIDYITERMFQNYPTGVLAYVLGPKKQKRSLKMIIKSIGRLCLNPMYLKRKKKLYKEFNSDIKYLPLSDYQIISNDATELFERIKDKYDIVIVGSDAIWEFKIYPFPNAYFMYGDIGKTRLLSYAASSDRMHISELSKEQCDLLKNTWKKFYYLGIRDVATENLMNSISSDLKHYHNCDPTVFIDLSKMPKGLNRIIKKLKENKIDFDKPIIGVMGGDEICIPLRRELGKEYQIVCFYEYSKAADYYIDDLSPIEWTQVFSLFSVTVTRFFHGSLLSLKNGTPTVATDFWYRVNKDHITKIEDLYIRLDLENHYINMRDTQNAWKIVREKIDYYMKNPDTEAIYSALEKESHYFDSFKEQLNTCIRDISGLIDSNYEE